MKQEEEVQPGGASDGSTLKEGGDHFCWLAHDAVSSGLLETNKAHHFS
jgi:hypothetical protein